MTTTFEQNGTEGAEFWAPRRALTLDAARRHSASVKLVRRILMGCALALAATLVWYFMSAPETEPTTPSPDETVKMVNPIYKGRTADGLPYRITADSTVQYIQKPDEVQLTKPILNFLRNEGAEESQVFSDSGLYNRKDQILLLSQNVKLSTDDGYQCTTASSRIFVKGKRIDGVAPIACLGSFGQATGHAYEINDNYREFIFKNGMTALLVPNEADDMLRGPSSTEVVTPVKPVVSFDTDQPVGVVAQKAIYKGPKIELIDDVNVRQNDVHIVSNHMDLFREKELERANGSIKYGNVNRIVASGDFKYTSAESMISGDKGVYVRDNNTITVEGDVVFTRSDGSSGQGCKLVYDLTTNIGRFSGNCGKKKNGRVVVVTGG